MYVLDVKGGLVTDSATTGHPLLLPGSADPVARAPQSQPTGFDDSVYQRLLRAFPDRVTLAQVSFSQIVGVKKGHNFRAIWNRYNRLTADFVVCNKDEDPRMHPRVGATERDLR